jgi:hypothetical protein
MAVECIVSHCMKNRPHKVIISTCCEVKLLGNRFTTSSIVALLMKGFSTLDTLSIRKLKYKFICLLVVVPHTMQIGLPLPPLLPDFAMMWQQ